MSSRESESKEQTDKVRAREKAKKRSRKRERERERLDLLFNRAGKAPLRPHYARSCKSIEGVNSM